MWEYKKNNVFGATAFSAWYTSATGILNTVNGRVVLPVGPVNLG